MNKLEEEWVTSVLTISMSIKDTKKMLETYNKMLSKSKEPIANTYWKFWEANLDEVTRNFVKIRSQGVLDEGWDQENSS